MTMINVCLFCGEPSDDPDHLLVCDGRQGRREAETFPPLVSGLTPDTFETSEAAADSIEHERDTQRAAVFAAIKAAGADGRTDDELQTLLGLDGSSERPRRWELWKRDHIRIQREADGRPVHRLTRTNRKAVVWIAQEA